MVDPTNMFDSVSYTAVPDETPGDGPGPEYEEIIEEPSKTNGSLVPAQAQSGSNHYRYSSTPQPPGNNHDYTIVNTVTKK